MKNTLLALLGFILLTTPLAATAQQFGDFTYTLNGEFATITGYTGAGGAVTIPDLIPGPYGVPYPVTTIGSKAFFGKGNVTSFTIPNSVTSIQDGLFPYGAFRGCTGLTSVTIPDTVTKIGNFAFALCASLTNVLITDGIASIGAGAFEGSLSLTFVTIPGSVTNIGNGAFAGCTSLISISVDAANTTYSSLDGVLFDNSLATLIQYPVGKAGSYPVPGTVANIGTGAFSSCHYLTSVTVPPSVTNFGTEPFAGCTSLTGINVDASNASYSSLDGVLFDKNQTTLVQYPPGKTGSYLIPSGVTNIGIGAFSGCVSLFTVTIPGSVVNIGIGAFENCFGLTSVTIPANVNDIQTAAFESCTGLTNVMILNGVTSIGYGAFQYCRSLTRVMIPGSVTSIGGQAFWDCNSLANITIPGSVTYIGGYAFVGCTSLRGIFFQGNAPSLGSSPLDGLGPETVYYLPGTIGWGAFFGGLPTCLWNPLMQSSGVGQAGFGFNLTGTTNIPIVVEAATSLANTTWVPLQSLNLTNGAFYFSDPNWTNYPARFYRIRSP